MIEIPERQLRILRMFCGALALAALALTVRRWWFGVSAVDAVYYAVHPAGKVLSPWWALLAASAATAVLPPAPTERI